jgi:hypothetical protein
LNTEKRRNEFYIANVFVAFGVINLRTLVCGTPINVVLFFALKGGDVHNFLAANVKHQQPQELKLIMK